MVQVKSTYYFDDSNHRLFNCESTGSCHVISNQGYYAFPTTVVGTTKTVTSHPLIQIGASAAATEKAVADITTLATDGKYFIDGSSFISDGEYSKLFKCRTDGASCSSYTNKNNGDVYLNAEGSSGTKTIIKCDGESFKAYNDPGANKYFINGDSANKLLISCNGSGCSKVANPSDGAVYLDESSTSKLIKCSGDPTVVCTSSTASSDDIGFYPNAAGATTIIKCVDNDGSITCSAEAAEAIGYYKNAASTHYTSCSATDNCVKYPLSVTECTSNVGKITNSGVLCLDETISAPFALAKYLINLNGTPTGFPKLTQVTGKYQYLVATENSIIKNAYGQPINVDLSTLTVSDDASTILSCASGVCARKYYLFLILYIIIN